MSHPLFDRVVADSVDPAAWHHARIGKLGASDAAGFAKVESVERYVRAKLMPNRFEGNQYTRAGHTWEPSLMTYAGLDHNTRMFRHESIPEFVATPDGVKITPTGQVILGEAKVKHKPTKGPNPAELRQVAWAQFVCDAVATIWVWLEVEPVTGEPTDLEPQKLIITRDDDRIRDLVTIANPVLAAMRSAASFESTL